MLADEFRPTSRVVVSACMFFAWCRTATGYGLLGCEVKQARGSVLIGRDGEVDKTSGRGKLRAAFGGGGDDISKYPALCMRIQDSGPQFPHFDRVHSHTVQYPNHARLA